MKKIYEFRTDEEKYMIVNMNPNEKKEAFEINKKEMQFDTNKFYQYVFADIEAEMEIEILDTTNDQDKAAKRVYNIISEITSEVMKKMNEKCFTELIKIIMNNYVYDDEGFFRVTEIFVYGSGKRD